MLRATNLVLAAAFALVAATAWGQGLVGPAPNVAGFATSDQVAALAAAMPGLAPVQSVNGATGAITVPTYTRQVSPALVVSTADGTVTWSFPTAFNNMPSCFVTLSATTTSYTFDFPEVTAISKTSVSLLVTAHPKSITIASLTLPIVLQLTPAGPPAGTTVTLSCLATP